MQKINNENATFFNKSGMGIFNCPMMIAKINTLAVAPNLNPQKFIFPKKYPQQIARKITICG